MGKTSSARKLGALMIIPALLLFALWPSAGWGSGYPERPITVVVPFDPGAVDREPRVFAPAMEKVLGQPTVVENRPGAGSATGTNSVARATPDGYTLIFTSTSAITLTPHVRKLPFSLDDFTPLACMTHTAQVLAVSAESPLKTVQEFVEYAKKNPGKIKYGTAGVGTAVHIAGEAMAQAAGIKMTAVPYQGMGPATNSMLGGHIDAIFVQPNAIMALVKGGKIRVLANCAAERYFGLPDVPAITETKIPYDPQAGINWFGYLGPKGLPQPIANKFTEAAQKVINDPEIIAAVKNLGGTPDFKPPKEFRASLEKQSATMKNLVEKFGMAKK